MHEAAPLLWVYLRRTLLSEAMKVARIQQNSQFSFRGKIIYQVMRDYSRLLKHFATSVNVLVPDDVLTGDRLEFRVELVTPVDALEDDPDELRRRAISVIERKLRRGWPRAEIHLMNDTDH